MSDPTPFELLRQAEIIQSALDQTPSDDVLLDCVHAAYLAGHAAGYAAGQGAASVDLARTWLIELAHDQERLAVGEAARRHGADWAGLIARQSGPSARGTAA